MWRTKLAEEQNQELLLLVNGSFTNNLRKCVYELLGCHVAQDKVPKVIESVLTLAKAKIDKLPSNTTIRNINKEMVAVSQLHLENLTKAGNLSLQSDETPKFGESYEAFIADDDSGNSFLLGMRHMADKSAQSCLDTLKEIISDINGTCERMGSDHVGFKILTNSITVNNEFC